MAPAKKGTARPAKARPVPPSEVKADAKRKQNLPPDQIPLTSRQADRLSKLTGVKVAELRDRTIAQLTERLKWQIDLELLLFRRICGQVVKTDPISGVDYPVPFATVHVEDTDCSFLGFFPIESPWAWLFPVFCHREDIATVVTDECGHFCVWVPRFDIDWILRFRRERFCYPDIFIRPNIRDILERYKIFPPPPPEDGIRPPIGPGPDPAPFILKDGGTTLQRVEALLGRDVAQKIALAESTAQVGSQKGAFRDLFDRPAFTNPVPPPIPHQLREQHATEGPRAVLARAAITDERFAKFSFDHFVGPLLRCFDVFVPEFVPIVDVPDITFRVTQDVDGDGTEELIYSEGFFDVRWNAGAIPDVTLHASPIARVSTTCDTPVVDDCHAPEIQFAGLMPVSAAYLDPATGYGTRPNRPHPHGFLAEAPTPGESATAPFMGTVQLYGCNVKAGAHFYRLKYSFNGAAAVPFTNLAWWIWPWGGGLPHHVVPDANGWYDILPNPNDWFPPHLLLDWPTSQFQPGLYEVFMELGNAAKAVTDSSPHVRFRIDNSAPTPQFTTLAWRVAGAGAWNFFPNLVCPVVRRPANTAIEFRVSYVASASHLLKTTLDGSGCGGDAPNRLGAPIWSDPATPVVDGAGLSNDPYDHWHIDQFDNTVARTAIFSLPGTAPEGAYGFSLWAYSRAFNSAGGDASDPLAHDWFVDTSSLIWNYAFLPVAVVNL